MNIETIMQLVTYLLFAIGGLAFVSSLIVQTIKEMPLLVKIPTNVVALVISLILCPVAVVILCQYFKIVIEWYYIFASFIAAFIVYLVSTGGWERVAEMWKRTKYNKQIKGN
ncbi:MAG: ribonuclease [Tyzzerella sp.]|nr:ribonuclease [Tyzzerella sp.]